MLLGIELITETTLSLIPGHIFRLELYNDDVLLPLSVGTDTYNYNGNILPHKKVAATGRRATYELGTGLKMLEAEDTKPVPVLEKELSDLKLRIKNNKVLDQAEIKTYFSLRIHNSNETKDILLARPDVHVYWDGRGDFSIPLNGLL